MASLDQINRLAQMTPVIHDQAAKQIQAGQELQLKAALAKSQPGLPVTRVAQALAPQAATQQGQAQLQAAAQTQQQLGALGQQALGQVDQNQRLAQQRAALGQQEALAGRESTQRLSLSRAENSLTKELTKEEISSAKRLSALGIDQDNRLLNLSLRQREDLSDIGQDVKNKIIDSRLRFERDEAGRKFTNERQLADYVAANARTQQDFDAKMRDMKQETDKKIFFLEALYKRLETEMTQDWRTGQAKLDYNARSLLVTRKREIEERIAEEKARANNNMMMAQGVGAVIGGVVGAYFGGPVGASVGAGAGSAAGGAIYGAVSD